MKRFLALILSLVLLVSSVSLLGCGDKFTVTFDGNGGTQVVGDTASLEQEVSSADELVEPKFERAGYDFNGWDLVLSEITTDVTVKAQWKKQSFTVTFEGGGGKQAEGDTASLVQTVTDASILIGPKFEREGYTFNGWSVDLSAITANTTVIAQWKANEYTISFDKNGGEWDNGFSDGYTVSATYGEKIADGLMPTATRTDKKFEKWVIVDNDSTIDGKDFSPTVEYNYTKDLKLKISWVDYDAFVITYSGVDSTGLKTNFKANEQPFQLDTPAARKGYIFSGWSVNGSAAQQEVTINPSEVTSDLICTAVWTAKTYEIRLEGGSEYPITINRVYDQLVGELPKPTKEGFTFLHWEYTTGITFAGGDNGARIWDIDHSGVVSLVAKWTKNAYKVKFGFVYEDAKKNNRQIEYTIKDAQNAAVNANSEYSATNGQSISQVVTNFTVTITNKDDGDDYAFSYWAYKDGNSYVNIADLKVTDELFANGELTLYAVCRYTWIGPY